MNKSNFPNKNVGNALIVDIPFRISNRGFLLVIVFRSWDLVCLNLSFASRDNLSFASRDINQPCPKWVNFLRKSGTSGNLARNGQRLYDSCWEIRLVAALLLTFMSHIRPVPSPQRGFGGLSPPNHALIPHKSKYEIYKLVEFWQIL